MTKQAILLGVLVLAMGGASSLESAVGSGAISGRTLARGEPAPVKMNLHRQPNGQFFGSVTADEDGRFVFAGLPLGEYTLVTWPLKEMPVQWSSIGSVELTIDRASVEVPALDCYSVEVLKPLDGTRIEPESILAGSPLVFEWTPYGAAADYVVEIASIDGTQSFKTARLSTPEFGFEGTFGDGSRLTNKIYRWSLTIYPEGGFWQGRSRELDLATGDLADLTRLRSPNHMELTIPKWYLPTAEAVGLVKALDTVYQIEYELSGAKPFEGKRYGVLYDPEITFAHSGNPLHMGKPMWKDGDFAWDILLHEMGHDFQTGALPNLYRVVCSEHEDAPPFYVGFTEGLATLAGFWTAQEITRTPEHRGLDPKAVEGIIADVGRVKEGCKSALEEFEKLGCPRDKLTPDVVDGFLLRLADEFGWDVFPSFFRAFEERPETTDLFKSADSDLKREAIVVCAFSLACGKDIRDRFERLGLEVDEEFYEQAKDPLQIAIFGDRP